MYFRARYYDPETGEFISRDPLGYVDGNSMYRGYFVPSKTDPSGTKIDIHMDWKEIWKCGGLDMQIRYIPRAIPIREEFLFVQKLCLFADGWTQECEEQQSGCPCKLKKRKPCKPVCFYEYTGRLHKSFPEPENSPSDHIRLRPHSSPFDKCASNGRYKITHEVYFFHPIFEETIEDFFAGFGPRITYDTGCGFKGTTGATPDSGTRVKETTDKAPPGSDEGDWWFLPAFTLDRVSTSTLVGWNCCGSPKYQAVIWPDRSNGFDK
jgi:hypothetical protein